MQLLLKKVKLLIKGYSLGVYRGIILPPYSPVGPPPLGSPQEPQENLHGSPMTPAGDRQEGDPRRVKQMTKKLTIHPKNGHHTGNRQGNIMANYGNSRGRIKFDFGLNLGFIVFITYLSDLVYRVGFVTGITFKTYLSNTSFIDLLTLW